MSAPKPPCRGCTLHKMGRKSECERWAIYQREFKAWKDAVTAEKSRYLNNLDAEIRRKAAEKRKKRRKR